MIKAACIAMIMSGIFLQLIMAHSEHVIKKCTFSMTSALAEKALSMSLVMGKA